jgi:uncharacterized membrane protein
MSEQFWVTGADGKEYGPVPLETLTRWIREGRIVANSTVRTETSPKSEARLRPELAAFFASVPAPPGAGAPGGAPPTPAVPLPAEFRVWEFIGTAWSLVIPHWLPLVVMFLILIIIGCVPNIALPHYGGTCLQFLVGGAISIGLWRAILGMIDGRPPEVGMMFEGFNRYGDGFLAYLVQFILVCLGLICLIVPGVILALMWIFTYAVLAESPVGFWEAMHQSAVLTEGYRWRLFLLVLACVLVFLLGLIAACVGILVALPVNMTAFGLAYRFLQAKKAPRAATA